jgi:hypothetical protein
MHLPGFDVLRVPARVAMVAVLCQSILVAFVLARWSSRLNRRVLIAFACAGIVADGWVQLPVAAAPRPIFEDWRGVDAIVELPIGDPPVDFSAIYRSMFHRLPIVNGYSGYAPPHYIPLAHALRDGQYEALQELSSSGRVGVVVDRSAPGADRMMRGVAALPQVREGIQAPGRFTFVVAEHAAALPRVGAPIAWTSVTASHHPEDLSRLRDRRVDTAWASGPEQIGGEVVTIDFGELREVGAVVFRMGAFAFGFPRELVIEASPDGAAWATGWRGRTAVDTVRAAIADPGDVPVTIPIGAVSARYLRLRQTGHEPGIPWWIAELEVHAPAQ